VNRTPAHRDETAMNGAQLRERMSGPPADPTLLDKLKRLGRYEAILDRLSTIEPETNAVRVQLDHAEGGYTYAVKTAA